VSGTSLEHVPVAGFAFIFPECKTGNRLTNPQSSKRCESLALPKSPERSVFNLTLADAQDLNRTSTDFKRT